MTTRTIKLKSLTQSTLIPIVTDVRTFGEFKNLPEVRGMEVNWNETKLIDRASKSSFDIDEAVLPAIDSIMFITPTKTKSGSYYAELKAKIKEYKDNGGYVPFNYTHATTETMEDFVASIENMNVVSSQPSNKKTYREVIQRVIILEEEETDSTIEEPTNLAEYTTEEELQDEAEMLQERFN